MSHANQGLNVVVIDFLEPRSGPELSGFIESDEKEIGTA